MEAFIIREKYTLNDSSFSSIKYNAISFDDKILTWSDSASLLMWEVEKDDSLENKYTWEEAFNYAEKLNKECYAGFSDWKLPTIEELKTLKRDVNYGENRIKVPLSLTLNKQRLIWSSDSEQRYAEQTHGLYISFTTGREHNGYTKKYPAMCVRTLKEEN